jgi:hypothetical protein
MRMNELKHSPQDLPEPQTGDEKEVYAFYGLASYNAQVAERGLMQLALLLRLQRIPNATRSTYNQEYEALSRRSFGQILTELAGDETLASELRALLQKALNLRNHLTHHFFWDFAEEWFSQEGRLLMIQKLREAAALFSDVGDEVGRLVDELGTNLGIGHDAVLRMYERLLNEARQKYNSA